MRRLFMLACATLLVSGSLIARAADQDFSLINRTGYQINSVYVSPTSSNNWGADVLGAAVLPDGSQAAINFPDGTTGCAWDVKVTYQDGDTAEWRNLNLCSISRVTLFYNRQTNTTRATTE